MRLDKFLKVSRLIKQRLRAKELCDQGSVQINGADAKPAYSVKEGDTITLTAGDRVMTAVVIKLPRESVSRKEAGDLIRVVDTRWLYDD
ncbi:RNA-binding S4 domain-containing protein [bacterium]|nr:RNA-binding S4 domain-containing protein [candidate division CSSED10-310 bacterium]